jgi:hypothetical protein
MRWQGNECAGVPYNQTYIAPKGITMTITEIALVSALIAAVVMSLWLGFKEREF